MDCHAPAGLPMTSVCGHYYIVYPFWGVVLLATTVLFFLITDF
jgi:hypothetical protein